MCVSFGGFSVDVHGGLNVCLAGKEQPAQSTSLCRRSGGGGACVCVCVIVCFCGCEGGELVVVTFDFGFFDTFLFTLFDLCDCVCVCVSVCVGGGVLTLIFHFVEAFGGGGRDGGKRGERRGRGEDQQGLLPGDFFLELLEEGLFCCVCVYIRV